MIRSESLDALNAALSAAQGEFEAVSKTANNPFFKSKYAALPDVVKAATPILTTNGLSVWQGADTDEQGELLWTVVLHTSGQYIGSAARMLPVEDKNGVVNAQAQGSAITYQRRYQYMAALGLVADEDDDGNAASKATRSKPSSRTRKPAKGNAPATPAEAASEPQDTPQTGADQPGTVTTEQLENIASLYREHKWTKPALASVFDEVGAKGRKSDELSEDQASWVIIKLAQGPAEAKS